MNGILALLGLIPILLTGDFLRESIAPRRHCGGSLRLALAVGFGSGVLTLLLFYISLLFQPIALRATIICMIVISLAYMVKKRSDVVKGLRQISSNWPDRRTVIPILFIVLAVGLLGAGSLKANLGHDSLMVWTLNGKILYSEGGWPPPASGLVPRPEYPLLVSSQIGWIYGILNQIDEQAGKIIFVVFLGALTTLFYSAVGRLYGLWLALIFTGLMLFTPHIAVSGQSGYADIPLMLYIFGAAFFIHLWLSDHRTPDLLLGATLAALAIWVKREGIIYWLVTLLVLVGHVVGKGWNQPRKQKAQSVILFLMPALVIFTPWYLYALLNRFPNTDYVSISARTLAANADRIPIITIELGQQLFFVFGSWGILWLIFVLVTVWQRHQLREVNRLYLWLSVVLPILLLSFAYVFSRWEPFTRHIDVSLNRLISQVVPTAWFFIAVTVQALNAWRQELVSLE